MFVSFASLAFVLVLLSIVISVHLSPPGNPALEFGEQGLNTALKSLLAAMSGMAAALVFYIRAKRFDHGALLWLAIAGTCVSFALAARWTGGLPIATPAMAGWVGASALGIAALAFLILFGRELRESRTVLTLFSVAVAFVALDMVVSVAMPAATGWGHVLAESSGLIGVFLLFLAVSARLVLLIDQLSAPRRFG